MQTVGKILRAEREKKNLSIKDIELATSIRSLYIKAIEEDDYKVIPGEVYLKGFIRNYADYLGLNGQQFIEMYRQSVGPTESESAAPEQIISEPDNTATSYKKQDSKLIWVFLSIFLICVVGGGAWWYFNNQKPATPNPVKEAKPAPVQPAPPVQPPKPQTPPPAPAPVQTGKPVTVTAKFTANCWVAVSVDGKAVYEGIPKVGDSITWEGQNTVLVRAGNGDGIEVTHNGQAVGKLGGKGEVIEKNFSKKP